MTPRATLSVIITSAGDERSLERCLLAIVPQPDATEVIVADSSSPGVAAWMADRFPTVRVLQFGAPHTVPAMRWAAAMSSTSDLIAVTESRMTPAPDWCARLIEAHARFPDAAAIGGSVSLPADATAIDRALYLSEYPAFIPPIAEGPARHLTGANVSYKRTMLDEARAILEAGRWEPILHDQWLDQGRLLRTSAADVGFQCTLDLQTAAAMRFHYGRQYGADRSATWSVGKRLIYAAAMPLVPLVIMTRLRRALHGKPTGTWRWEAAPWFTGFTLLWALGEAIGYLAGPDNVVRVF